MPQGHRERGRSRNTWKRDLEREMWTAGFNQSIIYLFRITDIAQYDNQDMNSEQDAPGSSQALMVAFKKITEIHKIYQKYKI